MTDTYEAPVLTDLGTVETLTQGASNGMLTDKFYPVGTPVSLRDLLGLICRTGSPRALGRGGSLLPGPWKTPHGRLPVL